MQSKIKYFFKESWLLIVSSVFFGLLLAVTDAAWRPRIVQNQVGKFDSRAKTLLPGTTELQLVAENIQIVSADGKKNTTTVKKALSGDGKCTGWAFVCEGSGFSDKIKLVVAVDAVFEKLAGYDILASNETPGFGDGIKEDYFRGQFVGAPAAELTLSKTGDDKKIDSEIIAISGATVSSDAVVKIFNNYILQVKETLRSKGLLAQ